MSNPIGWCEETWNPITGCSPVSPACDHCYAARMATRLAGRCGYPADDPFRVTFHEDKLDQPLRWRKPRRIFVCSMGDLFHEDVHCEDIFQVWLTMARATQHTFLVLTKRPERMCEWITARVADGTTWREGITRMPLPNVWLGVTVENQEQAEKRIPILLDTPAARRFISCEPLLEPVDLTRLRIAEDIEQDVLQSYQSERHSNGMWEHISATFPSLDWVICGGENGPGARPMHPKWAGDLYSQCRDAGIPFYFKGNGAWVPDYYGSIKGDCCIKITGLRKEREIIFRCDGTQNGGGSHPVNMHKRRRGEVDEIEAQYREWPS